MSYLVLCCLVAVLFPSYPFTDDTCPPLESVVDFCENAKAWLDAHEENVVSLHCKKEKGRASIMAACLMVRMGETAEMALSSYDEVKKEVMGERGGEARGEGRRHEPRGGGGGGEGRGGEGRRGGGMAVASADEVKTWDGMR